MGIFIVRKKSFPTNCHFCKRVIYRTKYELKRSKNSFCSDRDCKNKWKSEFLIEENNPNYTKEMAKCENPNCDNYVAVKKPQLKANKKHFCNIDCKSEF